MNARFASFALALVASATLVAYAAPGGHGPGTAKLRPGRGKAILLPPVVDPPADPPSNDRAACEVRRFPAHKTRPTREWLRFKLRKLDAGASYSIWIDDPATVDVVDYVRFGDPVTMSADGGLNVFVDTKKGQALPFPGRDPAVTVENLLGLAVEIRSGDGLGTTDDTVDPPVFTPSAVVLTGNVPQFRTFK